MKHFFKSFLIGSILCNMAWVYAQNPAKILAPNYYKNSGLSSLPQVPATISGYHGEKPIGSQNIQMDGSGTKILFFMIDEHVYNRKGELIGDLPWQDLDQNVPYLPETAPLGVSGEVVIVPAKQCGNEFYIFSTYKLDGNYDIGSTAVYDKIKVEYDANDNLLSGSGLYSETLNGVISPLKFANLVGPNFLNAPNGNVTPIKGEVTLFAVSKSNTSGKRFIYVQNDSRVFRFKIDNGNLSYDNYMIDLVTLSQHSFGALRTGRSYFNEMEMITLPNGNLRLALPVKDYNTANSTFVGEGYFIVDCDGLTGAYMSGSLKKVLYQTNLAGNFENHDYNIKGAEFSPNGNKLYLSHRQMPLFSINSTVDMFDLTAANPFTTRVVVSSNPDYAHSQIELDNQGGILIPANNRLSRIANSNNPSFPADFINQFKSLSNYSLSWVWGISNNLAEGVRLLQDQLDDENYSQYGNLAFSTDNFTVNQTNLVWEPGNASNLTANNTLYITKNITIPAGKTLTIKNMNIFFGENARVIVENSNNAAMGGYLILDNSKLSADAQCGSNVMWRGLEVRGNSALNQGSYLNSKQGRFRMINNSLIEHAYIGVAANSYTIITLPNGNKTYQVTPNQTGGILRIENSFFKNNQRDVEFYPYNAPSNSNNSSLISNTKFETNGMLNIPSLPLKNHIDLLAVKGINILGCDFINSTPGLYAYNKRGIGINAKNSTFFVLKRCVIGGINCIPTDASNFDNLYIGINATSGISSLNASFYADGSNFTNNLLGINTLNTLNHKVVNNTFIVPKISPNNTSNSTQTAGLFMKGSTGYAVEGNQFITNVADPISLAASQTYGIVVNNSGEKSNLIYRNYFESLRIGGQSEGINSSLSTSTNSNTLGLQWKCNTFRGTLNHDLSIVNGRINHHQGTNYSPPSPAATLLSKQKDAANNAFSAINESATIEHDIVMSNSHHKLLYVYNQLLTHTPDSYTLDGSVHGVLPILQTFNGQPVIVTSTSNNCPVINSVNQFNQVNSWSTNLAQLHVLKSQLANSPTDQPLKDAYYEAKRKSDLERDLILQELQLDTTQLVASKVGQFLTQNLSNDEDLQAIAVDYYLSLNQTNKLDSILNLGLLDNDFVRLATILKKIALNNSCALTQIESNDYSELATLLETTKNRMVFNKITALFESCEDSITYSFMPINYSRMTFINEGNSDQSVGSLFSVYPNPSDNQIHVNTKFDGDFTFDISTIHGKSIGSGSNKDEFIQVINLLPGMYVINFKDSTGKQIDAVRFIKN